MKYILTLGMFVFGALGLSVQGQSIDIRGLSSVDCGTSTYCLKIQVRAADTSAAQLGTSSILYRYDSSAIAFSSFTPLAFDGSDLCDGGVAAWDAPTFDASIPGVFSMTMILKDGSGAASCPTLDNTNWVDVADVCYSIVDADLQTAESFDVAFTHFNVNTPDDGTVTYADGEIDLTPATCGADMDVDGIPNAVDNCVDVFNPMQTDFDNDGIGDSCDAICNMQIASSGSFVLCDGTTVTLNALSTEGTAPYTYNWSTGETTSSIMVTPTGIEEFYVTITDVNNCIGVDSMELEASVADLVNVIIYDLDNEVPWDTMEPNEQYNLSELPLNWNIEAVVAGDVESVGFDITGAEFDDHTENFVPYRYPTDAEPVDFEAGVYTVSVSIFSENWQEGVSCESQVIPFEIIDDCAIVELIPHTHICEGEDFTLYAYVNGAHGAYSVDWSTGDSGEEITVAPVLDTDYTVTVTDASNCYYVGEVNIDVENNSVDDLIIFDVNTELAHDTIEVGEVYVHSTLPDWYTIEALTSGSTSSVLFFASGAFEDDHLENSEPYRFYGDNADLDLPVGSYSFSAFPYQYNWADGPSCVEREVTFHIVDDTIDCKWVSTTIDSLYGSLPFAIDCASPGDTIYFTGDIQGDTIELKNYNALVDKDLSIIALPGQDIYVRARTVPRVFDITPGSNVLIRGLNLMPGGAAEASAIDNQGDLILRDVHIYSRNGSPERLLKNTGSLNIRGTTQVFDHKPGT